MKLKEFSPDNCSTQRGGQGRKEHLPAMSLNKKGLFRLNIEAIALIGLREGDHLLFHQDEDDTETWYLEKVASEGFQLRSKPPMKGLFFNNSKLVCEIADSVAFTDKSGKCLIAGEPTEFKKRQLWGILTSTLRNK